MLPALIEWVQNGAKPNDTPPTPSGQGWGLLVIDREGERFYAHDCPYAQSVAKLFACGSGGDYATGAMHAGKTPAEAIRLIIDKRLDVHTGGEIQVIDTAEALGLNKLEAAE